MTTSLTSNSTSTVELKPSYNIPVVLIVGSVILLLIRQPVAGGIIGLFGLFLMYQAITLRIQRVAELAYLLEYSSNFVLLQRN